MEKDGTTKLNPKLDLTNSHTFRFEWVHPVTGKEYSGNFTIHRPNIRERIRIGVIEAQELGGLLNVDSFSATLANMVATFDIIIDTSPDWFKPREIHDVEVLQGVFEKYLDYLQQFRPTDKK